MCKEVSPSFLILTILAYISIFTASLLNMIFSIVNNPSDVIAFKEVKLTDYYSPFNELFLEDIELRRAREKKLL